MNDKDLRQLIKNSAMQPGPHGEEATPDMRGKIKLLADSAVYQTPKKERKFVGTKTKPNFGRKKWIMLASVSMVVVVMLSLVLASVVKYEPGNNSMKAFKSTAAVERYIKAASEKEVRTQSFFERLFRINRSGMRTSEGDFLMNESGSDSSFSGHSTTNNQVEGVSESDVVHTDGQYIYALGYQELTIAKLDTFTVAVKVEFNNFFPSSMYLLKDEGMLVILGGKIEGTTSYHYWYQNTACVRVYDIEKLLAGDSDALTRELAFPYCYISASRMIGAKLYLVYNLSHYNLTIPEFSDSATGGEYAQLPAKNIYASPDNSISYGYIVTVAVDLVENDIEVKAYFGSASIVYASQKAFYISFTRYTRNALALFRVGWAEVGQKILRFEINGASLKYEGAGSVKGFTLNQFGFDEHTYANGKTFFRVATTHDGESFITVFNTKMKKVGSLSGLGKPGEQIYSVRFRGETAVVVTFMRIDPLYVIDLSNPTKPKKLSELEIPGVSDYLHFLKTNPDLVFAVGRNETLSGIKVSLFDISTEDAATEIEYFEPSVAGYSYSEATYNHKAIMYFMPEGIGKEIFAFPINAYQYKLSGGRYVYEGYCALLYYTVDAAGNFVQVEVHYSLEDVANNSNWLYYRDSLRRSVMADGYLYLIGVMNIERYVVGEDMLPDLSSKEVLKIN